MRDNAVERLFSLFTSSDQAEAMAGDLAEERPRLGWVWFWVHVARTTLALWRTAVTDAPILVLLVAVTGCAMFVAPAIGGVAAVNLFPHMVGSPLSWLALSLLWCGGALWTGASLVVIAPQRAMAACATLAVAAEAMLIGWGVTTGVTRPVEADFLLFYTTALLAAPALAAGAAIARQRLIVSRMPRTQHQ